MIGHDGSESVSGAGRSDPARRIRETGLGGAQRLAAHRGVLHLAAGHFAASGHLARGGPGGREAPGTLRLLQGRACRAVAADRMGGPLPHILARAVAQVADRAEGHGIMKDTLVFECELPEGPEKVWKALTVPELLASWLLPNDIRPVQGARFSFESGGPEGAPGGRIDCEVLKVEPLRLLRYSWRTDEMGST